MDPPETQGVHDGRPQEDDEPGDGPADDELGADDTADEADKGLRQAADADDLRRERVLGKPPDRAREQPDHRTERQRGVHDGHEDEIDHRLAAHREAREGRLQRERDRDGEEHDRRLHRRLAPAVGDGSSGGGCSTTSTSSTFEKSTIGRTLIVL